ncbi:MAG TPA: glycine--tRNA ligase subunit alpha [Candidatus Polarisedimenticolaceae bacterium]|nr:glycine--tRNA ligase subunit alpha [Candidatus Polarisedimenticolaceae bacterium]
MTFQELLLSIQTFWARHGCVLQQPYDLEVGAGTMHPDTFFRVLGPEPWRAAYCQPSRRPADGRFGDNPMRVYKHYQFQVILKPAPLDVQDLYLDSLRAFGIDPLEHDIRFEEDNWESPTLGAAGVGWQVVMDGMEISQFTYFQQAGGQELSPISVELTYGLERICMFLNDIRNIFDIPWNEAVTYGQVRHDEEVDMSGFCFRDADAGMVRAQFEGWEAESSRLLAREERPNVWAAYEAALKCSHLFNLLDARGAISVTERAAFIARIRKLAVQCASAWLARRQSMEFPLLPRETLKAVTRS